MDMFRRYMIRRWRPTYLTFRIVVASTVGWEDDPDGDALLASTVLDAIAGGQEEFDSRAGKDLSNAQSDNRAPRLTYKRVLVAWHDSPDKLSEVASGQGNNSPRSPRNHSMLKPLGTISVDYTSTITHTNIKVPIVGVRLAAFLPSRIVVYNKPSALLMPGACFGSVDQRFYGACFGAYLWPS